MIFFVLFTIFSVVFGQVKRQGTLDDLPISPFLDGSQSLEVQNQNAERGLIDHEDAEVEEVIEYVNESDPSAEVVEEVIEESDGPAIGRVVVDPSTEIIQNQNTVGSGSNVSQPMVPYDFLLPTRSKSGLTRNEVTWIWMGVMLGILLIIIILLACLQFCQRRRHEQVPASTTGASNVST